MANTQNFDGVAKGEQTLSDILIKFQKFATNQIYNTGGLAIKAGSSALAKTVNTVLASHAGVYSTKAAADMAALSGAVVPTGSTNIYAFVLDSAGTLTTVAGTAATTLAGVVAPVISDDKAIIGFITVANATGSDFTPGTTALDVGSLTVTYYNTPFPFKFSMITLP